MWNRRCPRTARVAGLIAAVLTLPGLAGCGRESGGGTTSPEAQQPGRAALTYLRDVPLSALEQFEFETDTHSRLEALAAGEGTFELVQRFRPNGWRAGPLPDSLEAQLVVTPVVHGFEQDGDQSMGGPSGSWRKVAAKSVQLAGVLPSGKAYSVLDNKLFIAKASRPLETLELRRVVAPRFAGDGTPTVLIPGLAGPGALLFDGHGVRGEVELDSGAELTFTTGASSNVKSEVLGPLRFEVHVDGELLAEFEQPRAFESPAQFRRVDLGGIESGRNLLEFRMVGADAVGAVVGPRVELREGRPTRASDPRPDVLLFIADTFRADNLTYWHGLPGGPESTLTPFLDSLAERSFKFKNTWSAAAATLPGHASMFTSMYPAQHGLYTQRRQLALDAPTLAAEFTAAGYRTVAITDGGNCSALYGFDQGFETFLDGPTDMLRTEADVRRALDVDDPRPLFLFVQTYRVHTPYEPTGVGRARVGDAFDVPESYDALMEQGAPPSGKQGDSERFAEPLRGLYLAGVASFDAEFEQMWKTFEAHGFGEQHALAFTSDHGEAFGEHGRLWHGFSAREQQLRVPLMFKGAGVEAGEDESLVSLVDLAPTLAALAGVGRDALWIGRDLFDSPPRDVIGAQVLGGVVWDQVLIGAEGKLHQRSAAGTVGALGPFTSIFDDPTESDSIQRDDPRWPTAFEERVQPTWEFLITPMLGELGREVSAGELAELQALGYLLDEDEE